MGKQNGFERFQEWLEAIGAEMRACLAEVSPGLVPFYGMMAYHLGWQDALWRPVRQREGKRLRPLLCLLASEAAGGSWRKALPPAAAVELLHDFTLIHDDVEDNSPLRRGRPAVWSVWGIPQAINAGDGLFVIARMALLRLRQHGLPAETILQAVEILDRAILVICQGQYLDLSFEGSLEVDEAAYRQMISWKTAALLEASMHLGALVGGGSAMVVAALRAYGQALGMAFQVQDDLLGVWGEEERTGKPAAADVHGRKLGLPVVHGLAHAHGPDREILARLYSGKGPMEGADVAAVLGVLERTGSRVYVERMAASHHEQALEGLCSLPAGPPRDALEEIAALLLGRQS